MTVPRPQADRGLHQSTAQHAPCSGARGRAFWNFGVLFVRKILRACFVRKQDRDIVFAHTWLEQADRLEAVSGLADQEIEPTDILSPALVPNAG